MSFGSSLTRTDKCRTKQQKRTFTRVVVYYPCYPKCSCTASNPSDSPFSLAGARSFRREISRAWREDIHKAQAKLSRWGKKRTDCRYPRAALNSDNGMTWSRLCSFVFSRSPAFSEPLHRAGINWPRAATSLPTPTKHAPPINLYSSFLFSRPFCRSFIVRLSILAIDVHRVSLLNWSHNEWSFRPSLCERSIDRRRPRIDPNLNSVVDRSLFFL